MIKKYSQNNFSHSRRSETEIMASWASQETPLVSIICLTFNQENFICDAIDGFLQQETDFPFEIIIHDDASTDNTSKIVKEYAKKYPNIIKPIFQSENQYQHISKNILFLASSYAKGKYIACCEGDDYWIDSKKLQIQISEMQKHPQCATSFHTIIRRYTDTPSKHLATQKKIGTRVFPIQEVILGGVKLCPTVSCIFKASILDSIPAWLIDAPVADYFIRILGSMQGGALYLDKVMGVYRIASVGSWTEEISSNGHFLHSYFLKMMIAVKEIDIHTKHRYSREFEIIKKKMCFSTCANPVLTKEIRNGIYLQHKNRFGIKRKILWHFALKYQKPCRMVCFMRQCISRLC